MTQENYPKYLDKLDWEITNYTNTLQEITEGKI